MHSYFSRYLTDKKQFEGGRVSFGLYVRGKSRAVGAGLLSQKPESTASEERLYNPKARLAPRDPLPPARFHPVKVPQTC